MWGKHYPPADLMLCPYLSEQFSGPPAQPQPILTLEPAPTLAPNAFISGFKGKGKAPVKRARSSSLDEAPLKKKSCFDYMRIRPHHSVSTGILTPAQSSQSSQSSNGIPVASSSRLSNPVYEVIQISDSEDDLIEFID